MTHRAAAHLMFAGDASPAIELYKSTFPSFQVESLERYGPGEPGKEGSVKRAEALLSGLPIIVIDSPVEHDFTLTPAISLFVDCDSHEELDAAFSALSAEGQVYMPPDNYGFSSRFGWCSDRYGVSWQLSVG